MFITTLLSSVCLMLLACRTVATTSTGLSYVAAVFEHHPEEDIVFTNKSHALAEVEKNLDEYEQAASKAHDQGAHIIIFPEDGIDGLVTFNISLYAETIPALKETVKTRIVPCFDYLHQSHPILHRLSCIALKYSIAVVANMADHNVTTGRFYNTDVAFDTDGRLLMKYHKQHLFFENFTPGSLTPEYPPVFTTSFGVTFGMCTCYDILFPDPCHQTVLSHGATDLAFPTAWMNAGPLLYSTTIQQAFSALMNVTVLAANLHWPKHRFTGSGIFTAGGRPVDVFMSETPGPGRLLVAPVVSGLSRVPLPPRPPSPLVQHMVGTVSNITSTKFYFRLLHAGETHAKSCHFDFCCSLDYELTPVAGEVFALGAASGLKSGQPVKFRMEACAVVKCSGSSLASCSQLTPLANVTSKFSHLSLSASFAESVDKTRMYPVVLSSGGSLIDFTTSVDIHNHALNSNTWSISLKKPTRVATAGLFAHPSL